jgi:hypothetical protein
MTQERRFKQLQRELESKFETWRKESGLPAWCLAGSNRNFCYVQGKRQNPQDPSENSGEFSYWTRGFAAFVQAKSPCRIFIQSDFLRDSPKEFNKGLALADTLGTEVLGIDAQEFAKEKKRMLRDPETRAKIKAIETETASQEQYVQQITLWQEGTTILRRDVGGNANGICRYRPS